MSPEDIVPKDLAHLDLGVRWGEVIQYLVGNRGSVGDSDVVDHVLQGVGWTCGVSPQPGSAIDAKILCLRGGTSHHKHRGENEETN